MTRACHPSARHSPHPGKSPCGLRPSARRPQASFPLAERLQTGRSRPTHLAQAHRHRQRHRHGWWFARRVRQLVRRCILLAPDESARDDQANRPALVTKCDNPRTGGTYTLPRGSRPSGTLDQTLGRMGQTHIRPGQIASELRTASYWHSAQKQLCPSSSTRGPASLHQARPPAPCHLASGPLRPPPPMDSHPAGPATAS